MFTRQRRRRLFMFLGVTLLLWHTVVLSEAFTLPDTGQTNCYDTAGTEIACTATGQDGDKKVGVAWPTPRFTVSGECVTDNLTGLIWAKNANLPNATKTWQEALDYVASLNAGGGLCGNTDWRLPQILELESLVHEGYKSETCGASTCGTNADWLNTQGFINAQWFYYWSSSTSAINTGSAWYVYMGGGVVSNQLKANSKYVWPVRGGQSAAPAEVWKSGQTTKYATGDDGDLKKGVAWPTPRFTDNGNGTATDNLTGLIWLKNANCFGTNWQEALNAANGLANGQCGLSDGSQAGDWRLPNKKELLSLVDFSNSYPALPAGHPFTNAQSDAYWSSSTFAYLTDGARGVYMGNGGVYGGSKANSNYVWPVRGAVTATGASLYSQYCAGCHGATGKQGATVARISAAISSNTGGMGSLSFLTATQIQDIANYLGGGCTYTISPTSQTFASAGGTGSVSVTATSGSCLWTATSSLSWATMTTGSGTGSGTAGFSVSANTTGASRTGNMTVAGQTFTITQAGATTTTCTYTISPASQTFTSKVGTGSVTVTASSSSCSWTASEGLSWVSITSGSSGTGSGTVTYSVSANTNKSTRTGNMTIAGKTFTITQKGKK